MKFAFGTQIWLRDNHFENFYRMLDEMALEGLDGFEICFSFLREWYAHRAGELRTLLDMHRLEICDYYAGVCFREDDLHKQTLAEAKKRYEFMADLGYEHVLMDEIFGSLPLAGDLSEHIKRIADCANQTGYYAKSLGLNLSWHNHWGSTFETPEPFAAFVSLLDNDYCGLCLDLGQLKLGGFNEVETVEKYISRIRLMHFKDVTFRGRPQGRLYAGGPDLPKDSGAYLVDSRGRWVEMGRGEVDFKGVTRVLLAGGYDGWIIDDHDSTSYTARQCVAACKEYLNYGLGIWTEKDFLTGKAPGK